MSLENKFNILCIGNVLHFIKLKKPLILLAENLKEKINFDFNLEEINYLTMDVISSLKNNDYDLYIIGDLQGREAETMKFIKEEKEKSNIFDYKPGLEVYLANYCSRLVRAKFGFKPKQLFPKT